MVQQEMTDSGLPQPFREERLAERIIDLVRAGERELLALQPDLRAGAHSPAQNVSLASRRVPIFPWFEKDDHLAD